MPSKSIAQRRLMGMAYAVIMGRTSMEKIPVTARPKVAQLVKSFRNKPEVLREFVKTSEKRKKYHVSERSLLSFDNFEQLLEFKKNKSNDVETDVEPISGIDNLLKGTGVEFLDKKSKTNSSGSTPPPKKPRGFGGDDDDNENSWFDGFHKGIKNIGTASAIALAVGAAVGSVGVPLARFVGKRLAISKLLKAEKDLNKRTEYKKLLLGLTYHEVKYRRELIKDGALTPEEVRKIDTIVTKEINKAPRKNLLHLAINRKTNESFSADDGYNAGHKAGKGFKKLMIGYGAYAGIAGGVGVSKRVVDSKESVKIVSAILRMESEMGTRDTDLQHMDKRLSLMEPKKILAVYKHTLHRYGIYKNKR